ncbi:MAG: hypothetical protein JJ895_04485 [Balneolaceae bacterium]|nr:hypothetical protein [Balneolaceae bacterium]
MKENLLLSILLLLLVLGACKPNTMEEPTANDLDKEHLFNLMDNWYLWNHTLPENPDLDSYENPADLLNQVRFKTYDRWSSVGNASSFNSYYEEGTYFGYGFSYGFNSDNELRIKYVYDDSPFARAGVQRGWMLTHIDGTDVQTITDWSGVFGDETPGFTQSFTFKNASNETEDLSITKDVVTINSVLYADTLSVGTETVGYMVFNNFIEPSRSELDDAFIWFASNNISKLILDLRYNGGGRISVATYLSNYIIDETDSGKDLYRFEHNDDKTDNNDGRKLTSRGVLNIHELIVLSTEQTASASELVLNGLKPLMNVTHIGTANTYGKPVGTYSWFSLDETQVYSIISFKFLNSNGEGDFFDGIEPDFKACDDLKSNWGDTSELMLAAALQYIETGEMDECSVQTKLLNKNKNLPVEGYHPAALLN